MISYCIAAFRPTYSRLLIADLIRKTSVPFEILLWLNVNDSAFDASLQEWIGQGQPLRIVGRSPGNIGMQAYPKLFACARHDLLAQIDDDVIAISPKIAERAQAIFRRFPEVKQVVADVWQDDLTTGARPPLAGYRTYSREHGLYEGPLDGWFSIFPRTALGWLPKLPANSPYFPLGAMLRQALHDRGFRGLLCTQFKVFHVIGPEYASYFGMLDAEIEKYRRLGRSEIVRWYEDARDTFPSRDELGRRVESILAALASPDTVNTGEAGGEDEELPSAGVPGWEDYGGITHTAEEGVWVMRKAADDGPGTERGLVSLAAYDNVELRFELKLGEDACFLAKIHQAGQLDQCDNSYHLYCHPGQTYLAMHHHVFQHLQLSRNEWQQVVLRRRQDRIEVEVNGALAVEAQSDTLERGYCFLGLKGGTAWLRAIELRDLPAADDDTGRANHPGVYADRTDPREARPHSGANEPDNQVNTEASGGAGIASRIESETEARAVALENPELVARIKQLYAGDGGAEREHNASEGSLGFGIIHYSMIVNLKPARVLAIGSRYGYIPSIMGLALKANGTGQLDFVDANFDDTVEGFATAFGGVGHWTASQAYFDSIGLRETVQVHIMRTAEFFERCRERYGYIYIDGDHSYEGCRFDFQHALDIAEPRAFIALHDVLVNEPEFGVNRVFAELDADRFDKILVSAWPGLAIVQRKPPEAAIETKNPLQVPRYQEILQGRKFWGYLDTEALQTRYVLAAHFLRDARHIIEIGGYRQNAITFFLKGHPESVTVYSLDAEFEPLARDDLNGAPCRVRHIQDYFQGHDYPREGLGLLALGMEIVGDLDPFCELLAKAQVAVLEIPVDHAPGVQLLETILARVPHRLHCQVNLDLSPNEVLLREELLTTNMNAPFWRRNLYVLSARADPL